MRISLVPDGVYESYQQITPELLQRNLKDYEEVLAGKEILPGNF